MTLDEVQKVLTIMLTADGKCPYCAEDLVAQFIKAFPEHMNLSLLLFKETYPRHGAWRHWYK